MRIANIEQGAAEWHAWRAERLMASEAPIVMECAPNWWETRTWTDLRALKTGFTKEPPARIHAMRKHGRAAEAGARAELEAKTGFAFTPICGEAENEQLPFAASFDGVSLSRSWCEIKCPAVGKRSKLWRAMAHDAPAREILAGDLAHYWWQLVHQAIVFGLPTARCYFACSIAAANTAAEGETLRILEIEADCLLVDADRLKEAWQHFEDDTFDRMNRLDSAWLAAAAAWVAARDNARTAAAVEKNARAELIDLAGATSAAGGGVRVTRVEASLKTVTNWRAVFDALAEHFDLDDDTRRVFVEHASEEHERAASWRVTKPRLSPRVR